MNGIKPCSRCSGLFRCYHGNQKLCGECRKARPKFRRGQRTFGLRHCLRCTREYLATAEHQRYCSDYCRHRVRARLTAAKYANPVHRGRRKSLEPVVASGLVRCARGAACERAELVDGFYVGGFILPGERWHLGHADGESVGGPEHVRCNTGAPSRLRGER